LAGCRQGKSRNGEAKEKGSPVGEPFKYWCWLQDLNPPPPDYKSGANSNNFKDLAHLLLRNPKIQHLASPYWASVA